MPQISNVASYQFHQIFKLKLPVFFSSFDVKQRRFITTFPPCSCYLQQKRSMMSKLLCSDPGHLDQTIFCEFCRQGEEGEAASVSRDVFSANLYLAQNNIILKALQISWEGLQSSRDGKLQNTQRWVGQIVWVKALETEGRQLFLLILQNYRFDVEKWNIPVIRCWSAVNWSVRMWSLPPHNNNMDNNASQYRSLLSSLSITRDLRWFPVIGPFRQKTVVLTADHDWFLLHTNPSYK